MASGVAGAGLRPSGEGDEAGLGSRLVADRSVLRFGQRFQRLVGRAGHAIAVDIVFAIRPVDVLPVRVDHAQHREDRDEAELLADDGVVGAGVAGIGDEGDGGCRGGSRDLRRISRCLRLPAAANRLPSVATCRPPISARSLDQARAKQTNDRQVHLPVHGLEKARHCHLRWPFTGAAK